MKHSYLHILLVAFVWTPLVAQNEIATKDNLEKIILDCPITSPESLIISGNTACTSSGNTGTKEVIPTEKNLQTATVVHFVDQTAGQDSLSLVSDGTTHLDPTEPIIIDALFLYPNPSSGMVQIKLPGKVTIQVYTIAGQLISRHQLPPGERILDLTALAAGVYQIRAKSDEDYFSGKLLIQ